jgi:hypothetical protein
MQRPLTRRKPAAQACRTVVLRLHTPLTRCIPGPHASRTGMTMSSSCWMDPTGMACVDEARPKMKRIGTNFFIVSSQEAGWDHLCASQINWIGHSSIRTAHAHIQSFSVNMILVVTTIARLCR